MVKLRFKTDLLFIQVNKTLKFTGFHNFDDTRGVVALISGLIYGKTIKYIDPFSRPAGMI
jgi:hypothetical protein